MGLRRSRRPLIVAGPIQTSKVARVAEHAKLRDLYPVVFQQRLTLIDDGQYGGKTPWPLEFERAGREAKFLWLGKTADESEAAWDSFPGVFGYYDVKGEKPGATVYARFSDPQAAGMPASGPFTWPASSTAPARCSTSAAAKCGGCAASTRPTSKCSTPS